MQGNLLGPKYDGGTSCWAEIRGKAKFREAAPQFRSERPEESVEMFPKGFKQICNTA